MNDRIHFIYVQWHERAKSRDVDGLLELYASDAVFESPLVPVMLKNKEDGVLRGKEEIKEFLMVGTQQRPDAHLRWYRSAGYLADGRMLAWEYPRETPEGEQIDISEVMEIEDGLIKKHRIYLGWRGCSLIAPALAPRNV